MALSPLLKVGPISCASYPLAQIRASMVATASRIVNAIPSVVDAPAGLVGSLDLPLTLPRSAFA